MTAVVMLVGAGIMLIAGACWLLAGGGVTRGTAPGMDIVETMSATAMRRRAVHARPALRVWSPWRRPWSFTPVREVGVLLGRALWRRLYSSIEAVLLIIAPPRSFKTLMMSTIIQDAPGAVLATSTRDDLIRWSTDRRDPATIWVLNHERLGNIDSTLCIDITAGCRDEHTATIRAADQVAATSGPGKDAQYWLDNASAALRCLMMAADLDGRHMDTVWRWINSPRAVRNEAVHILKRPGAADGWHRDLDAIYDNDIKFIGSLKTTLRQACAYMSTSALVDAVVPSPGRPVLTPEEFYAGNHTVFLIARHRKQGPAAPLFAALEGMFHEALLTTAAHTEGRRVEPPPRFVFDEAPNTARIDLPQLSRDIGGAGGTLVVGAQTFDDLESTWGREDARTLRGNAEVVLVGGGVQIPSHLDDISKLFRTRFERNGRGHDGYDRVPPLQPGDIRQMRSGQALVLHRTTGPVVASVPLAWRRAKWSDRRAALLRAGTRTHRFLTWE